jgi:hypothetical protein
MQQKKVASPSMQPSQHNEAAHDKTCADFQQVEVPIDSASAEETDTLPQES